MEVTPTVALMPLVDETSDGGTPWFSDLLKKSFHPSTWGLLIEQDGGNEPHYFISVSEFELWVGEVEKSLGHPLGRKLAHAAAESEEYRFLRTSEELVNSFFKRKRMQKRFEQVNENWNIRGFGQIELMKEEKSSTKIIIHHRAHSAIAAGLAAATYEILTDSRYRFHWTDDGNAECLVTLETDRRQIPPAQKVDERWQDDDASDSIAEGMHPLELAFHEGPGQWSIDGIRMMGLRRDMFLRFEESIMPQVFNQEPSSPERYTWNSIQDEERKKVWSGFAEASRKRFLETDSMVLVAELDHWIHVGHRFLTRLGLGGVKSAEQIDEAGGIKLHLPALFHPAIAAGVLSAAWERVEARPSHLTWSTSHNGHFFEISSLHDLA
jgi:hypothetical protein